MSLDQTWVTEAIDATGTAFALKGKKLHEEQTPY
ncbi:MAG: polyamine aminopropyltransferase, partial [Nevskiaceae bacterium]